MTKRTKAVRAELVVRMGSIDQLRRRMDAVERAVDSLAMQIGHMRQQIDRVDSMMHVLSAELLQKEGAGNAR